MSEFPKGFRPVVLSAEETAAREAAKQAANQQNVAQQAPIQQSTQDQTTVLVNDNKAMVVDSAREDILTGDVLVENSTALDLFVNTQKDAYVVKDPNFKNDLTGQTEIVTSQVSSAQDQGMEMFFKP